MSWLPGRAYPLSDRTPAILLCALSLALARQVGIARNMGYSVVCTCWTGCGHGPADIRCLLILVTEMNTPIRVFTLFKRALGVCTTLTQILGMLRASSGRTLGT